MFYDCIFRGTWALISRAGAGWSASFIESVLTVWASGIDGFIFRRMLSPVRLKRWAVKGAALMAQFCAALDTAHVCADGGSINAEAIAHFPGRQAACPKPQSFSDLPHGKSRHWGPPAPSKMRKATRRVIAQHRKQTSRTLVRAPRNPVRAKSEPLSAILRYAQL